MKNFYVFEGLDGSGKSSQIRRLASYLEKEGKKVWITAEPTDSEIGQLIRKILRKKINITSEPKMLLHLYTADRLNHVKEIKEHLYNEEIVICDRYYFSSIAYQGVTEELLGRIKRTLIDFLKPEKVFYINTPVDVCLERIASRQGDREVFEKKEFLFQVKERYERYWEIYFHPIFIDGTGTEEEVFEEIKKEINLCF